MAKERTDPSTWPSASPPQVNGTSAPAAREVPPGLWADDGGEGAKFWLSVLTEIRNRGVADVCILVCDGLKGLPHALAAVWEQTVVQTCIIHLGHLPRSGGIRNTFRYASRADRNRMSRDLRPVYTAPSDAAAKARFADFAETWAPGARPSCGCGATPGRSPSRSWPTTRRSAA